MLGSPQANISQASDGESDRELILTREEIAFLQGLFADKDFADEYGGSDDDDDCDNYCDNYCYDDNMDELDYSSTD